MPRPRTPINAYGRLTVIQVQPGKWRARARYRFENGTLKQVERFGSTKAAAEWSLKSALTTMVASAGVEVRREMRLADLADRFLQSKADRAPRTVDTYRQTIEHLIKPNLGQLAISEATTERLQRFISRLQIEHGQGAAKSARAVLSGMLGMAARSDAIRSNPIRDLSPISRQSKHGAAAIALDQLPVLLQRVREDARLQDQDMVDLIEFLAATGCRVGEACGLQWDAVDLDAGTVTIRANAIRAHGQGVVVQDHAKTRAGSRTIAIPANLVSVLRRRKEQFLWASGFVFPTSRGNIRDPRNTSKAWWEARERLGFSAVSTHSFRKTVATALDQAGLSARDIAEYLGHENPSITQDVYMAKNTGGRRAAAALGDLFES